MARDIEVSVSAGPNRGGEGERRAVGVVHDGGSWSAGGGGVSVLGSRGVVHSGGRGSGVSGGGVVNRGHRGNGGGVRRRNHGDAARVLQMTIPRHISLESLLIGGVVDDALGAVSLDQAVAALDHVSVARLLLGFVVTGVAIGDSILELVVSGRLWRTIELDTCRHVGWQCSVLTW